MVEVVPRSRVFADGAISAMGNRFPLIFQEHKCVSFDCLGPVERLERAGDSLSYFSCAKLKHMFKNIEKIDSAQLITNR